MTNYSNEDLDKYFNRNEKYGIKITNDQKKQVLAITGAQPYWLDILFQEYEKQERRVDDFSILFQDNRAVFYQLYKGLLDLLKDQDLLDKLYQILFGPCMDYTIEDVQKLLDYGIISRTQTSIELMSENLLNYIKIKEQTFDFYPLWNKTENNLRKLLHDKLCEKYGGEWERHIEKTYPLRENDNGMSIGSHINNAVKKRERMKNPSDVYYGGDNITLLDGLTTAGLFELYYKEYQLVKDIFKMERKEFAKIGQQLTRGRNPYQHNNNEFIRDDYKLLTKSNCIKINSCIEPSLNAI